MRALKTALAIGLSGLWAAQASASDLASAEEPSIAVAADAAMDPPAAVSAAASLAAQDAPSGKDWEVAFTPYLWVAGVNGDIGIPRGEEVEVDKSFADTLSDLKFAFMGALDVKHGRFVALADVMYLSVGTEAEGNLGPLFVEGEVDSSVFVGTAAVGYRVVDQGPMFVDLVAGARLVTLKADVELTGPLTTRERDASKSKVAALVGGRIRVPLGENWGAALYGDVGTGGVRWQMVGTIQWDISTHWRLAAGYRHMSIKHDTERFNFDIALSGPILGVSYRF